LPEKYDPWAFSKEEKERFISALMDGFYRPDPDAIELEELELPAGVRAGLLTHRVYYDTNTEYDGDETEEFWQDFDEKLPAGFFAQLPLNFSFLSLAVFFIKQESAYRNYIKTDKDWEFEKRLGPKFSGMWDAHVLRTRALAETYSKPWYEYHILEKFKSLMAVAYPGETFGPAPNMKPLVIIETSAQLGRLIEQYYWKFVLEKSAIRGEKISQSAKSGGHLRASMLKHDHARWQSAADEVWQQYPKSHKTTVASIVKKRLKLAKSEKHISRVLTRPK
jgi:hypothetical protein